MLQVRPLLLSYNTMLGLAPKMLAEFTAERRKERWVSTAFGGGTRLLGPASLSSVPASFLCGREPVSLSFTGSPCLGCPELACAGAAPSASVLYLSGPLWSLLTDTEVPRCLLTSFLSLESGKARALLSLPLAAQ